MKARTKTDFMAGLGSLATFVAWTLAVRVADVKAIGPRGSAVGFATLNGWCHEWTGANMSLYVITDWLGLVPIGVAFGFAVLGLCQWIKRKRLDRVDCSLMILGGFYIAVMAVYALFEVVAINHRPVLIDGRLETSYPSSTTMLVMCVMPTAVMQWRDRLKRMALRRAVAWLTWGFVAFMVVGRVVSGVHWISDIIGGALVSVGLVLLYRAAVGCATPKNEI